MEEHKEHLQIVLIRLREHKIYDKFNKCDFYKEKIQYLGHVISAEGITVDPEKIRTIIEWKVPKNTIDIQYFMGLASYYLNFIEGFSNIDFLITSLQ